MAGAAATNDNAVARPSHLFDLPDELLTQCAAALATLQSVRGADSAADLCRLASVSQRLCRLILTDAAAAALPWALALRHNLGWRCETPHPSSRLYRALSTIERVTWKEMGLDTAHQRVPSLAGRSSSAACRLGPALLMYGGTLNGNFGPLLDDLLLLAIDRATGRVTVETAPEPPGGRGAGDPGPRRGHSMTATALADGEAVACLLGGWGDGEVPMVPHLLHSSGAGSAPAYSWSCPDVRGVSPSRRAFHSASEVAPSRLLVSGGLGPGCCRGDVTLLDLSAMAWSTPQLHGVPRCVNGRAGHGAAFVPRRGGGGGGELLLLSGAMRSASGDAHQYSVDVLEVRLHASGREFLERGFAALELSAAAEGERGFAARRRQEERLIAAGFSDPYSGNPDRLCTHKAGAVSHANLVGAAFKLRAEAPSWTRTELREYLEGVTTNHDWQIESAVSEAFGASDEEVAASRTPLLELRWSDDESWASVRLEPVRTAWYATCARSVLVWSGVDERHGMSDTLTAVDVDRRIARAVEVNADAPFPSPIPTPRGGALCWPLSPHEALLFSGSNHGDESEMLAPWLLKVPLPRTP